jgi:hypothetical protein
MCCQASWSCPAHFVNPQPPRARRAACGNVGGFEYQRVGVVGHHQQRGVGIPRDFVPSALQQQRRCVVGAQGTHAGLVAPTKIGTVEERLTSQVDAKDGVVLGNAHHHAYVGTLCIHVGPHASPCRELVDDGILDAHGHELRGSKLGVGAGRIDGKRRIGREVLLPGYRLRARIQLVGVLGVVSREHQHHARGKARPHARAVGVRELAKKGDLAAQGTRTRDADLRQLVCQQALEASRTGRKELHVRSPSAHKVPRTVHDIYSSVSKRPFPC